MHLKIQNTMLVINIIHIAVHCIFLTRNLGWKMFLNREHYLGKNQFDQKLSN